MFSPKIALLYRMSNQFAKWAAAFCKLLPDSEMAMHHRMFGLSQTIPGSVAMAGSKEPSSEIQKKYLRQALESACYFASLLTDITVGNPTDDDLVNEGKLVIDALITLLVDEVSSLVLTDAETAEMKTIVMKQ